MSVLIDTSGVLAVLDSGDRFHEQACETWAELVCSRTPLFITNYTVVELTAVAQRKLGMDAVSRIYSSFVPGMAVIFVDAAVHDRAVAALLAANRRPLSLVDCTSFAVLHGIGIGRVFTFDPHFAEQGFEVVPNPGAP